MPKRMVVAQVAGLAAGVLADNALGDPRRFHPVAGFGQAASRLEHRVYAPTRAAGVRFAGIAVGLPVAVAIGVSALTARRPLLRGIAIAATTWAVLGGTSLRHEAAAMASDLAAPDGLVAARRRLPNLVGRDPSALNRSEIARATVESVAENTSDAQVAPLFWGAVAGLPGLVGYRAINTLDAMVGHRSPRYRDFGTAAARLDDVANLIPSRLTALLTAATAAPAGGDGAGALRTGGETEIGIPARIRGSAKRRWPVRWAYGSAAATSITAASRTARGWDRVRCLVRPTYGPRLASRARSASPRSRCAGQSRFAVGLRRRDRPAG